MLAELWNGIRRITGARTSRPMTPVILMYHRVGDVRCDPWALAVSTECFDEQMAILRQTRSPLPLSEFVARLRRGTLPADAVAVTFDDGYLDNLTLAKPILSKYGIPATLFLATGALGDARGFWWDELAACILRQADPVDHVVNIAGQTVRLHLTRSSTAETEAGWQACDLPRTDRQSTYLSIWSRLRMLPAHDVAAVMDELRAVLGSGSAEDSAVLSAAQVGDLISDGLVELGAHTVSHRPLPSLGGADQLHEIGGSRDACSRLAGRRIVGFAYPFGSVDETAAAMVQACGLEWACTTEQRHVDTEDFDCFRLPRLAVGEWRAPVFLAALAAA